MLKLSLKLIFTVIAFAPAFSQASVAELFEEVQKVQGVNKGPFGRNYRQGTSGRVPVLSGGAVGTHLFDAAFRNEHAQELADQYGFYTGNLFTTNYHELMGEFIHGDPRASFSLDHETLIAIGAPAITKANQMVLNWVLEKYYVGHFPNSGLARGFGSRGIAGSEYEQKYAVYFFNFYLSLVKDSYQYLPAYMLAKQSPIVDSSALAEARRLVEESYDYFAGIWGSRDARVRGLYRIRNAIHNNLSEGVLKMIDDYLAANPWYEAQNNTYLQRIHRILTDYFNASPTDLMNIADNAGLPNLKSAAQALVNQGVNENTLFVLSEVLAEIKKSVTQPSVAWANKAKVFSAIVSTSEYLNKETIKLGSLNSVTKGLTLLNMIFVEGLLIEDNWRYFYEEMANGGDAMAATTMFDVLDIASMTLDEVFGPTMSAWINASSESSLEQFRDDALKSSSLNSVSVILNQ